MDEVLLLRDFCVLRIMKQRIFEFVVSIDHWVYERTEIGIIQVERRVFIFILALTLYSFLIEFIYKLYVLDQKFLVLLAKQLNLFLECLDCFLSLFICLEPFDIIRLLNLWSSPRISSKRQWIYPLAGQEFLFNLWLFSFHNQLLLCVFLILN